MKPLAVAGLALILASFAAACGGESDSASSNSPNATSTRTSTGPTTTLNPKSGPPGIEVTASGSGWPPGVEVAITGVAKGSKPYTTALTDRSGSFKASFFLEKKPDGTALETGRFDIIASAGGVHVTVPYVVEVRRPVSGPGPGGG